MWWVRLFNDQGVSVLVNFYHVYLVGEKLVWLNDHSDTAIQISGDDQSHIQEILENPNSSRLVQELKCEGSLSTEVP